MIFHCNCWRLASVSLLLTSWHCCYKLKYRTFAARPSISYHRFSQVSIPWSPSCLCSVSVFKSILLSIVKFCHLALNILHFSNHIDNRKSSFKAAFPTIKLGLQRTVTSDLSTYIKWDWKQKDVCHWLMFVLKDRIKTLDWVWRKQSIVCYKTSWECF